MLKSKFNKSILEIKTENGDQHLDLEHEIGDVLATNDEQIIIRFELVGSATPDRNVICLDKFGKTIWRVQDPGMWRVGKKIWPRDLFGGIAFDNEGNLWASGRESRFRIDVKNGQILEEIYTK